ncbi:tRNA (N6-threonylcarbamoyladenosine(37)-N6)-methyltransferase TrmO [Roseibium aggregatum]|uniref:tRNA (N6-threonylcarbamoyladenosine(37)-N6)-methyltransferase TrmO n=1 Tax=Roseibium aggregatum TaxID=187304 RepID=UPI003A97F6A4
MSDIRPHEISVAIPEPDDARLFFIGRIHTPFKERKDCPRQGSVDGPECRIEIFDPWVPALQGLEQYDRVELLYWLDKARRDLVVQNPAHSEKIFGTFALRSPVRPNPIGTVVAKLVSVDGSTLVVRGLDCLDGTPLIDLKPDRCAFTPKAPPKD